MPIPEGLHPVIQEDLIKIANLPLPWRYLQDKAILITGGNGFLASFLAKSILTANKVHHLNCRVICIVRNYSSGNSKLREWESDPNLIIFKQDISQELAHDFPKANFYIHAASQASPKYYGVDPVGTLSANSIGTQNLLTHAYASGAEKFLFFSSAEVYGQPIDPNIPISETAYGYLDPMNFRSCYAESKRIGENMCVSWSKQFMLNTSVVRPFHTYGPGMALDDGRVFADFVRDVVAKKNIRINSSGKAMRAFCYLSDATAGFLTILLKGENAQAYNIGNPDAEISIEDLANTIAKIFPERNIRCEMQETLDNNIYARSSIFRICPDIEKIKRLGWAPAINIEDGFKRTISTYL
jgi:nucleoside-diphosphate-sugar epimerase